MEESLSISEASGRLSEIARFLVAHPERVVLVEHRDLPGTMALVAASHLRLLETQVRELKKQTARPFKLAGTITSGLSDHELARRIDERRAEQATLAERRGREFRLE